VIRFLSRITHQFHASRITLHVFTRHSSVDNIACWLDDSVMSAGPDDLQKKILELAKATDAPEDSFLMRRLSMDDAEQLQEVIDGIMLSLISFCYHRHPRGENVHEVMEELDRVQPGSPEAAELERRADDAAALQIPFIVKLNELIEDYYHLRRRLEARLRAEE